MFDHQYQNLNKSDDSEKSPILFLLFMLLVIQVVGVTYGPVSLGEGGLVDTDSYTRLNRVLQLMDSRDWFDTMLPRSNAPYGEIQHWTRPLDALLIVGAALVTPFVSFSTALHWWGVFISPLFQVVTLISLIWLAKPIFTRDQLLVLGGIFVLQPGVIGYYMAGRVDHHSILLFCMIFLLGCTLRMGILPFDRKICLAAGVSAGIGVWISVELMVGLFVSLAFLSCCWIVKGEEWSKRLMLMCLSLWGITTLALLVERGVSQFGLTEYDRFSVVYWTIFTGLAVVWIGIWLIGERSRFGNTPISRTVLGMVGGSALVILMWVLFPKFFQGPLVDVDPRVMTLVWERVSETQPLFSTNSWQFGRLIFYLGIALPGIPYLFWMVWSETESDKRWFWVMIGLGVLVYLPLSINELRWVPYAEFLMIFPYTHLTVRMMQRLAQPLETPWRETVKAGIVLVSAVWFVFVGSKVMDLERSAAGGTTATDCPLIPLSVYLSNSDGLGDKERTILAYIDFGPELLYRTPHRVVVTPYHRNTAGIIDAHTLMSSTNHHEAPELLRDRAVDLILLCPSSPTESSYYHRSEGEPSLYERLEKNDNPEWVQPVPLPSQLSENFKLYEVVRKTETF